MFRFRKLRIALALVLGMLAMRWKLVGFLLRSVASGVQRLLAMPSAPYSTLPGSQGTEFPREIELIPGKLKVRIYLHVIQSQNGAVPCWSYISEGLWAHGQKELVFTLSRLPDEKPEDYPRDLLDFLIAVHELAGQGKLVDAGGSTEFGPSGFLGRKGIRGVAYVAPQPLQGAKLAAPLLAGILLTEDEIKVVRTCVLGTTRVMANLGAAYRYYPYPPWSDRARGSVVSISPVESVAVLENITRAPIPEAWIRLDNEKDLILSALTVARARLSSFIQSHPPATPVALLLQPDPRANACFFWKPGQSALNAITPPESDASRKTGNFIAFVPKQAENEFRYIEDGFSILITNASWTAIREAMESGKEISIPISKSGMKFSLAWIQEGDRNPADGTNIMR